MVIADAKGCSDIKYNTIQDYQKTKAQLMQDLHALSEYSKELKLDASLGLIDNVLARLKEGRFTVAVVGEFKVGKSTFLNAILGKNVFPTDVIPTTATLNRATYGMEEWIEVRFKDGRTDEIGMEDLTKFVTKLHDGGTVAQTVDEAIVHYNAPYLMNNVDLIDTPGLNDEETMTETTLRVLPKADAAILVISAMQPFGQYTCQFLENKLLTSDLGRVIFVVSRIGALSNDVERDRIIDFIENRIKENVIERARKSYGEGTPEFEVYLKKIGSPKVFGVDSQWALEAKEANDSSTLEKSRFSPFLCGLERFLTEDRGAVTLQVPVGRIIASSNEVLNAITLREGAMGMDQTAFKEKYDKAMGEIQTLQTRKATELKNVDEQRDRTKRSVLPMLRGIDARIQSAAIKAIETCEGADADVKGKPAQEKTAKKLNDIASNAARREAESLIEQVTVEVNKGFALAADQLQEYASQVETVVQRITFDMTGQKRDPGAVGVATVAALTGLGGIWNGYKQAGIKGAIVGGVGSFATIFAAGLVVGLIGLPLTLPVLIASSLVGWFGGARIAKLTFKGSAWQQFRNNFVQELQKQLVDLNLEKQMLQDVEQHINEVFQGLKEQTAAEISALLQNTQATLDELRIEKEKASALSAEAANKLRETREKTTAILQYASRLNEIMLQKMSV